MNFDIDPRELNLQGPDGMQLVKLLRRLVGSIDSGEGGGGGDEPVENDEIFWCEYNVTTASEIIAALNNNQLPVTTYNGNVYVLNKVIGTTCYFASVAFSANNPAFNYIIVSPQSWSRASDYLQAKLAFDYTPTQGSTNPVTSGGVWTALQNAGSDSVSPYQQYPAMDGVASPGNSDEYARGNHVHPTDTSRASVGDISRLESEIAQKADASTVEQFAADAADEWLEQNVTQETGYVLDGSLMMSNAAAPADKVGEIKALSCPDETITVDFTRFEKLRISLSATQKWNIAATEKNAVRGYLVKIPDNAYECEVIGNNGPIAFLNSVKFSEIISAAACDMSTLYPTRISAFTGTRTYNLDSSTNYFYASAVSSGGVDLTPLSVVFRCKFKDDRANIKQTIVNKDYTIDISTALALYNECVIDGKVEVEGSVYVPQNSTIRGKNADSQIARRNVTLADVFYPVYVLNLQDNTKVEGLTICGQPENITLTGSFGNVNGIGWVNPDNNNGMISKCTVKWCIGAGVLLQNQGTSSSKALIIDNCVVTRCNYGIYIYQDSEYNIISNCQITRNYYGYYNRGGNNKMTNCGIDANKVGAQIDADYGANNGHGSFSNCTFNHTDSGNGYGVVVKDTGRMVITGCNFYYSKLLLQNTDGNVISGCGFGNSSAIEINQGDCSLIVGSMFRDTSVTITRTNNTSSKVVNCYYRSGVEVA